MRPLSKSPEHFSRCGSGIFTRRNQMWETNTQSNGVRRLLGKLCVEDDVIISWETLILEKENSPHVLVQTPHISGCRLLKWLRNVFPSSLTLLKLSELKSEEPVLENSWCPRGFTGQSPWRTIQRTNRDVQVMFALKWLYCIFSGCVTKGLYTWPFTLKSDSSLPLVLCTKSVESSKTKSYLRVSQKETLDS